MGQVEVQVYGIGFTGIGRKFAGKGRERLQ